MRLVRYEGNPILKPNPEHPWESMVTTNPGAWYDEARGEVLLLYRAAGFDEQHVIRLGLARSRDGRHFERQPEPVFGPSIDGFDAGCVEDPRVVRMNDYFYITYASRPFPPGQYWLNDHLPYRAPACPPEFPQRLRSNATATGLALTRDFKTFIRAGQITDPLVDDRNAILFSERIGGEFWMLHRPMEWLGRSYGTDYPAIWVAHGRDLLSMRDSRLLCTAQQPWERKIGANTPPIRTEYGWLLLYHAVGPDSRYRLGAMLLKLDEPTRVLHRTPEWLLEPEMDYEVDGMYAGCVFPCGKVVIDGVLHVYYGGADRFVGLATCPLDELLRHLRSCPA